MEHLENMIHLTTIKLESNRIKEIPEDIIKLMNLEYLGLSFNELSM